MYRGRGKNSELNARRRVLKASALKMLLAVHILIHRDLQVSLHLCPEVHRCSKFGENRSSVFQDITVTRPSMTE